MKKTAKVKKLPKQEKKYNFVYKTTNLINGKIYVGVRSTNVIEDGYIGCGIRGMGYADSYRKVGIKSAFISAVLKYGYDNFKREIIKFFDTAKEAYEFEKSIVTPSFVLDKNTYNLREGGFGSNQFVYHPLYDKSEEVCRLYSDNYTMREIGEMLGGGIAIVRAVLKYNGVNPRKDQNKSKVTIRKIRNITQSIKNDLKNGDKVHYISHKYNISPDAVRYVKSTIQLPNKYIGISPEKDVIGFTSFSEFKKKGLHRQGIVEAMNGKIRHYKGWLFYRKEEWDGNTEIAPEIIPETKHKGLKISIGDVTHTIDNNLVQFCKQHSLCYANVLRLITGKLKKYKNIRIHEEDSKIL